MTLLPSGIANHTNFCIYVQPRPQGLWCFRRFRNCNYLFHLAFLNCQYTSYFTVIEYWQVLQNYAFFFLTRQQTTVTYVSSCFSCLTHLHIALVTRELYFMHISSSSQMSAVPSLPSIFSHISLFTSFNPEFGALYLPVFIYFLSYLVCPKSYVF